ncbi:MAG: hypothetical protein Q9221_007013 [Calogaya cf. arnoldii]
MKIVTGSISCDLAVLNYLFPPSSRLQTGNGSTEAVSTADADEVAHPASCTNDKKNLSDCSYQPTEAVLTTEANNVAYAASCPYQPHSWADRLARWNDMVEACITELYDYLAAQANNDFYKQFLGACNFWFQNEETSLATIGKSISMLHNALLLAHYAKSKAQEKLSPLTQGPVLTKIFNEELLNIYRGQGMDVYWRETPRNPTEDDYLHMASYKAGGLFRLAIRLMQAVSESSVDLNILPDLMGMITQLQDDYLNMTSQPVSTD